MSLVLADFNGRERNKLLVVGVVIKGEDDHWGEERDIYTPQLP